MAHALGLRTARVRNFAEQLGCFSQELSFEININSNIVFVVWGRSKEPEERSEACYSVKCC